MNPYDSLPPGQFWRRSVSRISRFEFDPVLSPKFKIGQKERIATAGSCFAQHIAKKLRQIGFNYYVPEAGEGLSEPDRRRRNYGVFSARFGNLYTSRQLLQLLREAYGQRDPAEKAWLRQDGRYVDPYRPAIEPDGFARPEDVAKARESHLEYVRTMFEKADLFIFTLGLTECWMSRRDESVFPLAPGVAGGAFDPDLHAFANLTVADVESDLEAFLDGFRSVNPAARVLFTVSPVPLIATYEPRNVLVSSTYSKSVLRVAVERFWRERDWVEYFPSYEIITGSFNGGVYYDDDGREVNQAGVSHALRCFVRNYAIGNSQAAKQAPPKDYGSDWELVCEEEALEQIRV